MPSHMPIGTPRERTPSLSAASASSQPPPLHNVERGPGGEVNSRPSRHPTHRPDPSPLVGEGWPKAGERARPKAGERA